MQFHSSRIRLLIASGSKKIRIKNKNSMRLSRWKKIEHLRFKLNFLVLIIYFVFYFYQYYGIEKYFLRNGGNNNSCGHCLSKMYFILFHKLKHNYDINRNIRFFINLYLYLYLFKMQFNNSLYYREYLRG